MKKNLSIPKFLLVVFIITVIFSYNYVVTSFLNFRMKNSFFIYLKYFLFGLVERFVEVLSFLSIIIFIISIIKIIFYIKNQEKRSIIIADIKKYFLLIVISIILQSFVLQPLNNILDPFSTKIVVPKPHSNNIIIVPKKPVIYLYPEKTTNVNVKVNYQPGFSVTYPLYQNGWNVVAHPDGKLINTDGKEYSYLYWEGKANSSSYDLTTGFVIKGEDTATFLQDKLSLIGLNPKEYNEFIVYWLPYMANNPYNLIHFATDKEYNQKIPLEVNPTPDSVLRVFMVFKSLNEPINIQPQSLPKFQRNGFTVVEWGGSDLK